MMHLIQYISVHCLFPNLFCLCLGVFFSFFLFVYSPFPVFFSLSISFLITAMEVYFNLWALLV